MSENKPPCKHTPGEICHVPDTVYGSSCAACWKNPSAGANLSFSFETYRAMQSQLSTLTQELSEVKDSAEMLDDLLDKTKQENQTAWGVVEDLKKELSEVKAERDEANKKLERHEGKKAPVQGFSAGIPWSLHLKAYDVYCKKYGKQEALIDLGGRNCRGGFGVSELDEWIPDLRKEVEEIHLLRAELSLLKGEEGKGNKETKREE